jgi:hypothetical protein
VGVAGKVAQPDPSLALFVLVLVEKETVKSTPAPEHPLLLIDVVIVGLHDHDEVRMAPATKPH